MLFLLSLSCFRLTAGGRTVGAPRFKCQMVAGGIEGQVGYLCFGDSAPAFVFRDEGAAQDSTVVFPSYGLVSYYGAEQATDEAPMIFFFIYAKKKRGFRAKEAQRFSFQLMHEESGDASVVNYSRRVLIDCDTAMLKFQKATGTTDGKKKWSNVLSPRRTQEMTIVNGKGKEEQNETGNPQPEQEQQEDEAEDDVYGFGGGDDTGDAKPSSPSSPKKSSGGQAQDGEELTLIYEEDAMRRRDLLSSAVQSIDGLRFCGNWITNRKMFKSLVASQDEEPVVLVVTRRGLCMLKPVDSMLSAYHWSEIRSFGASTLPAGEASDAFVWMHKSVTYTVLLPVAEELETCCNNIINQALGGTFASRPIPKYYPPSEYRPEKDSDAAVGGQMLAAKLDNKPEKWTAQQERGEAWNKKHRQFLDAVIANDLHTVMDMVKDKEKLQLDLDYVDINGISPVYWAAIMGHTQIVSFLLPAGASVHSRDLTGGTPLHAAAYQGNQNIVSLLIKQGADVNAVNNAGQTPLHRAAVSGLAGGIVVCVGLAMSGCDVTAKDVRGNTALHLASLQGDANTCEALVQTEKGREVINVGNGSGRTPLHYAVLSGRKHCVEALLLVGADRFVKDGSGASSIDIARREVEDKEERETLAKAKGLVPTEGLQPAKDTLQLLLHWDPKKAGRLFRMKMMSTNEINNSPAGRRKGAGKLTDLKAAMEEGKNAEPVEPASPAKAAKLNALRGMAGSSSKSLGFDVSSMKEEQAEVKDIENDKGAVSDSLKEWESQAQVLKDRIAEREKVEAEAKAKAEAQAAEDAAIAAEEAEAAAAAEEIARAKAERAAAAKAAEEAEAAAKAAAEESDSDIDARVRVPDDAAWTNSPALSRRKGRGKNGDDDDDDDDGIRMWVSPKVKDGDALPRASGGVMPRHMVFRRPGSNILSEEEKAMLSGSLSSMIQLKEERGEKVNLVGRAEDDKNESPEEEAARLRAQQEADERVEALRLRLQEERRQRTIQRHMDEAERYEALGQYRDAVDEYRLVLEQGPSEVADNKIDELETLMASEASRVEDTLAEIEVAAALATEMSLGFGHLAGAQEGDKVKYGQLMQAENISADELLRLTMAGGDGTDEWDDAEFQATLEKNLEAKEEKKVDLLRKLEASSKPKKERIQVTVPREEKKESQPVVDSSDTWYQPTVDAPNHSSKKKDDVQDEEEERKAKKARAKEEKRRRKEQEKREAEERAHKEKEVEEAAAAALAAKKAKKAKKASKAKEAAASAASAASAESERKAERKSSEPAGAEDTFDKKAYNAHVRKAKALASEDKLSGALIEYELALQIRPGHQGLEKKVRSLKKKLKQLK